MAIGSLGTVTFSFSAFDTANDNLINKNGQSFSKTYTVQQEFQQAVSTSPVTPDYSALATTPDVYIYNATAAVLTITGTSRAETVSANSGIFLQNVNLATDLTFSIASGTGTILVQFFK